MSIKGGILDASGESIKSVRLVTDFDATSGLGTPTDPLRVDPTGTTVQPVSITSGSVTATVSGNVSVSNFPATQPVSIDSMPSTPVTGTFWQSTQPVSGTFWQSSQPVTIASMPSTPVTGTFWQPTQPVSATALPLPSNAAQETGGNLAAISVLLTAIQTLEQQNHRQTDILERMLGRMEADAKVRGAVFGAYESTDDHITNLQ